MMRRVETVVVDALAAMRMFFLAGRDMLLPDLLPDSVVEKFGVIHVSR